MARLSAKNKKDIADIGGYVYMANGYSAVVYETWFGIAQLKPGIKTIYTTGATIRNPKSCRRKALKYLFRLPKLN
jgi:hypothetical protein